MTACAYLAVVLASIGCVALVDHRWRLALWARPGRTVTAVAVGVVVFLVWDVVAIDHGFYSRGETRVMTGVELTPGLPLEELFFVVFLCYLTLVLHRGARRLLWARRPAREAVG